MPLKHQLFALEYCKDFNGSRAAIAAGYSAKSGGRLIKLPAVRQTVATVLDARCEKLQLDAEWVLDELVENYHQIMRGVQVRDRDGNPTGEVRVDRLLAIKTLEVIGKHVDVGAFREPVVAHTSNDLVERLHRGRERVAALREIKHDT